MPSQNLCSTDTPTQSPTSFLSPIYFWIPLEDGIMASATSSSAIGRGRAGRLPANPAKNGAAPPHTSRGLVVPPASSALAPGASGLGMNTLPSSTLGNVAPVSNIELFLANLRILDLDLLPDWPDISVQTFASSTASQGQKRRVQAVEWALYYLFSLWDVEEAQTVRVFNAFIRSACVKYPH